MKPRWTSMLALLAIVVSVAACGPGAATAPSVTSEPSTEASSAQLVAFTYADPESQGLSEQALQQLADEVQGYFDDGLIVGAELAVIKNRRVVLHEAIGWKDREDEAPMERNTLFNIRSMTKPVLGTITQMLIEEGLLALDDPVASYLPSFDNAKSDDITIEHLLTHRSGLPLTLLTNWPNYASLQQIAEEAGEHGPDFAPGSRFQYSDTGSDTLGAVLEEVSGVPLETLYKQRVLEPLSMSDTMTLIDVDDPRTGRICSGYMGTRNNWSRYWSPSDEPLYPFSMGSQSLYCTPLDYARFLTLWMDGGQAGELRLLSSEAVQRAMAPASAMKQLGADADYPTEFPGLDVWYGQMWMLYMDPEGPQGEPVAFGHGGSDGTAAWVWPERDLIVLYFTQSRGGATVIRFEEVLDRLLINPGAAGKTAQLPEQWEPYLGTYTGRSGIVRNQQYTVVARDGHLSVDIPEGLVVDLEEANQEGKWFFTIDPSVQVSFERDEAGNVVAMVMHFPDQTFELPRGEAPPEPALDLDTVQKYVGFYLLEEEEELVEILIHDGRLAVKIPQAAVPLELYPPGEDGKWFFRLNPMVSISFQESEDGQVLSFTSHSPEGDFVRPRVVH